MVEKIKRIFCDIRKVDEIQMSRPINKSFMRAQPGSYVYVFSMAVFVLQLRRVEKLWLPWRLYGLQCLRYLVSGLLQKKIY